MKMVGGGDLKRYKRMKFKPQSLAKKNKTQESHLLFVAVIKYAGS